MKTTELFVEQILIGGLVLFAGGLLFSDHLVISALEFELGGAVLLIGAVYFIGIVYDRYADTLLHDLEQHHRLWYALKRHSKKINGETDPPTKDPFPENKFVIHIREGKSADHASYLRSRIRLTRALTTLVPALSVGLFFMVLEGEESNPDLRLAGAIGVFLLYAIAFVRKLLPNKKISCGKLPKTYDLKEKDKFEKYRSTINFCDDEGGPASGVIRFVLRYECLSWLVLLLGISLAILAFIEGRPDLAFIPVIGVLLTAFIGWSWWRISSTYMKLLDDYDRFKGHKHSTSMPH